MLVRLVLWGLASVGGALFLSSCSSDETGSDFEGRDIPPLDPPKPEDKKPVPVGNNPINAGDGGKCVPPDHSLLLVLKGYGIRSPQRVKDGEGNVTEVVEMGPPSEGCTVMSIDRLSTAVGSSEPEGVPLWTEAKWSNTPSPFPQFNDPKYLESVNLLNGRAMRHALNDLYRGYQGSDIRKEGSWGAVYGFGGLADLGANASFSWFLNMTIKPDTCEGGLEVWQTLGTPDGISIVDGSENYLVLPFYRKEACDSLGTIAAEEIQYSVVCDKDSGQPCNAVGSSQVDKIEAQVLLLPHDAVPQETLDQMIEDGSVFGASPDFADEKVVVLDQSVTRTTIPFQLKKEQE